MQTFFRWVKRLSRKVKPALSGMKKRVTAAERWAISRIDKAPLASFFTLLAVCLVLIIVGNILRQPKTDGSAAKALAKQVSVYGIGESPKVELSAKVDKAGVITVVAQTAGVVQGVYVTEGNQVWRGTQLFSFSTNYQGGTIPSLTRQIAEKNYTFVSDNFDAQKSLIGKRRDIANTNDTAADDIRNITNQSIDDTKSLVSLNEELLSSLDGQLATLQATNVGGANDSLIFDVQQGRAGLMAGLNSLHAALRSSEYQASGDNAPAHLSDYARELVNQQLDLEEKSLELNKELSGLNLRIAQIAESLMYPVSPVTGTVERVNVHVGDTVNPGTVLATIRGTNTTTNIVVLVSGEFAKRISRLEPSTIRFDGKTVRLMPRYVSREPVDGSLFGVFFTLPEGEDVANKSYVTVDVPVSSPTSAASVPFVPIDAVYQTDNDAYLFVATKSGEILTAESRSVSLGQMVGSYVEVLKGIGANDQVIIDRIVSTGDAVTIK